MIDKLLNTHVSDTNKSDYNKILEILFKILSPIIIQSLQVADTNNIKTSFNKLIFSCFMKYYEYNTPNLNTHLKSTIQSLESIFIDLQSKQDDIENKEKSKLLTRYLKPKIYINLFNDIPKDLLSYSMSYIDAVDLTKLEIISHKFLQCARAPIAINILTQKFFDAIFRCIKDDKHRVPPLFDKYGSMKRYLILKNVQLKQNVLQSLMKLYENDDNYSLDEQLSWIHLDESSIKSLYEIQKVKVKKIDELVTINMNVIRGLKYMSFGKTLNINIHDIYRRHHFLFNNYLIWNNIDQIRSKFNRFSNINITLYTDDKTPFTRFLWFCACCHSDIEHLSINLDCYYPRVCDVTYFCMKNYKNIIPEMIKLKYLSIHSKVYDEGDKLKFIEDGKCFMNALMDKINKNTLQTIEFRQWYYSWNDIDRLKIWILNHYKTLNCLKFTIGRDDGGDNDFDIYDVETWKPIILMHEMIINNDKSQEIDYWLNNVLNKFEFIMYFPDPYWFGYELTDIIQQFEKKKNVLTISLNINMKIHQLIRYFVKKDIEWKIHINVSDPLLVYRDFFVHSHMNVEEYTATLQFLAKDQPLITDYFP